jgi:ABC-type transport system substrate-binding protein
MWDIVTYLRPLDTSKMAESEYAKVVKSNDTYMLGGWFNQRKKDSKWRDARLRQAVNFAINREELWEFGARGNAHNLGGFILPGVPGYDPNLALFSYDTAKTKALLGEAGYPNGFDLKMIAVNRYDVEARIVSKMLERIGLRVTLDVITMPQWFGKTLIPLLDKPVDQQDWDISIHPFLDVWGHIGAAFLTIGLAEQRDWRWMEYDPEYEKCIITWSERWTKNHWTNSSDEWRTTYIKTLTSYSYTHRSHFTA